MLICSLAYLNGQASIDPSVIQSTISMLTSRDNSNKQSIEKKVSQVARLWQETDGDEKAFRSFVKTIILPIRMKSIRYSSRSATISKVSAVILMRCRCAYRKNLQLDNGPLHPHRWKFGSYSPSSHLSDDLYNNKIAFLSSH